MTVTSLQAAQACFDLYDYAPSVTVWDYISPKDAPCYYGVTQIGSTVLVVFRGTTTLTDFMRILEVDAIVPPATSPAFNIPALGPVHPGAWDGLVPVLEQLLKTYIYADIQFTGHSLGAMRATLATATFAATFQHHTKPRIVFGECKSGYHQSAQWADVPGSISYLAKDGPLYDPFFGYPFAIWPEHYVHGTKPTVIEVKPDGSAPIEF